MHRPRRETGANAQRRAAVAAGICLAAMAALAPIAVFAAIPAGLSGLAGVVLLLVVVLDVVVAFALVAALDPAGSTLGRAAVGMRLGYAAVLAGAVSHLGVGDVGGFERVWDVGLFLFGAHLVAVGVLGWRTGVLPRWICGLVMLAGLGYLVDSVVAVLGGDLTVSSVSFAGEVVLLVWLLAGCGRPRRAGA